jgi:outer membrane receptor protein involved in Fe transport
VYAPPSETPGGVGGGSVGATVGEEAEGVWLSPAAWLEADWRVNPRLRLVGGVRVDSDTRVEHGKPWVDPRIAAFLDVDAATVLTAAAGIFGSAPSAEETSRVFGNPALGPTRALHLSLGARRELPWAARAELTGFYKSLWSLVVPTRALDAEGTALHLSNEGRGEVIGLELLVRRELARGLFGWLAWSWSRSIRRDDPTSASYPDWHLFELDQTHVIALILSYRLQGDWTLGTRVRAVTGNPYTPWDGSVLDADTGRYQCLPSRRALSARLPGFFQADARLDKRWVFASWMLSLYLDVQNVTNQENAELRFPSYDCTEDVPIPSIPFFPALGLRAEW